MEPMPSKQPSVAEPPTPSLTLTDPEAVAFLTSPKGAEMLYPFLDGARSASETAAAVGVTPAAMDYRIRKLLRLGLIEVTGSRPRRGPAIKLYRAVADRFVVPFDATPHATLETLVAAVTEGLEEAMLRSVFRAYRDAEAPWAMILGRNAQGQTAMWFSTTDDLEPEPSTDAASHPDAPAVWSSTLSLDLSPRDAKELQRELIELYERYLPQAGVRDGRAWLLRLALAPMDDLPTLERDEGADPRAGSADPT
jgi:DNA-binding Lrp family transcriptional regulator